MNPGRFRNSTSGQVIRVGQGEAAYWAFVPHPLPPSLPADWELTRALSEADRALSELAGLGRTMPNPHQVQRLLDVTYPSARRNVEKLVQAGMLQLVGDVIYGKTYVAGEIMSIIGEEHLSE